MLIILLSIAIVHKEFLKHELMSIAHGGIFYDVQDFIIALDFKNAFMKRTRHQVKQNSRFM